MKEEQNYNYIKKVPVKMQRGHQLKKKRKRKEKNREKRIRGESCRFWRKPIMLRWPYLWNPPLDHAYCWICCSHYTPLLTDRRDWKEPNLFDRNNHLEFHGKQKGNAPAGQFGRRPIAHSWICGAPRCYLHSGWWRSANMSPARFRAC